MDKRNIHGGDVYRNQVVLDFSVNTNPFGIRPEIIQAIRENADKISAYPDVECDAVKAGLASCEKVPYEWLLCGNGASELFYASVLAVKPKRALICTPGFSEYERSLDSVKAKITYYQCKAEKNFKIQPDILDALNPKLDMVFLCNPNNPTGQTIEGELLDQIIEKCKKEQIILVMDECYIDFVDHAEEITVKNKLQEYGNIILIKTLTKIFSIPGLRIGYAICSNQELLENIKSRMQPWNVSVLAQIGAEAALQQYEKVFEGLHELIKNERYYLSWSLQKLGYAVFESKANYLLFYNPKEQNSEESLYEKALKDGILIRDCSNFKDLKKGYYRIAIRGEQEDRMLIKWMKEKSSD